MDDSLYENSVLTKVKEAHQRALLKPKKAAVAVVDQTCNESVQLPLWPETARGVPNGLLRSALFGVRRKGAAQYLERKPIYAAAGLNILYSGPTLDQFDLSIWEAVLHASRMQMLGDECRVTAYQLLRLVSLFDSGQNRKILNARLSRLNATALNIQIGNLSYEGSLIDSVYRDQATRQYLIRLNPKLRGLFEKDQWTALDWQVRQQLAGFPLALWLHGFYSSHAKPFAYSIETLHALCGSENADLYGFKRDLRKAFALIAKASEQHQQIFNAEFKQNIVHVTRTPSTSQAKFLKHKFNANIATL
ncbi:TrfA protein [Chitinibacter bivalviorum]|uniref:TrfA protein n=1 Tax=Chitinibacter bivalviorum TaxID=2739434 RepID=A0A7H9BHH4_9NEIS|nr:plasmid replication initiator TrfA [Chitinibacter bivalviorum]QLG88180.1 TrfA protein [Chitinibacter bivalviorum]